MTVPVIPGPFSFLARAGEAVGAVQGAVDDREDRRRRQAQEALGPIFQGIAAGSIDPKILADPGVRQQFAALGTPAITPEMVIPSLPGEQARAGVEEIKTTTPDTEQGRAARGLSPLAAIRGAELTGWLQDFRLRAAQGDPEAARIMAEVPDLAEMIHRQAEPFNEIARSYVSANAGDAKKAWQAAQQDPRLAPLITEGQLSERYFSDQATLYKQNEEAMQAKLSALFRERRLDSEAQRVYISDQIRRLDEYIKGLEASKPEVNPLLSELPAFQPEALKAQGIDSLINEARATRDSLQNVYNRAFPTATGPAADSARAGKTDRTTSTSTTTRVTGATSERLERAIALARERKLTAEQIDSSSTLTAEEKAAVKKALGL